jgi:hypothetical protein
MPRNRDKHGHCDRCNTETDLFYFREQHICEHCLNPPPSREYLEHELQMAVVGPTELSRYQDRGPESWEIRDRELMIKRHKTREARRLAKEMNNRPN